MCVQCAKRKQQRLKKQTMATNTAEKKWKVMMRTAKGARARAVESANGGGDGHGEILCYASCAIFILSHSTEDNEKIITSSCTLDEPHTNRLMSCMLVKIAKERRKR